MLKKLLKNNLGFTLIEVLIGMMALAIAIPMGMGLINDALDMQQEKMAAGHFEQVKDAVKEYMKDNYVSLMDTSGKILKDSISFTDLNKYVSSSMRPTNVWGQEYKIKFFHTTRGSDAEKYNVLNAAIVTSGGKGGANYEEFSTKMVPAAAMRGKIGYVVPINYVGEKRGDIQAADGTYAYKFSELGLEEIAQGHLADVISMDDLSVSTQYLYRDAIPGHPELNAMNTNLSMGGGGTGGLGNPKKNSDYPTDKDSMLAQYGGYAVNNIGSAQLSPLNGEVMENDDGSIGGFYTTWVTTDPATSKTITKTGNICDESNYDSSTTADGKIFYYHTNKNKDPDNSASSIENNFGLMQCRNGRAYMISDSGNSLFGKKVTFATDGELVDKPKCSHIAMKPTIYVTPTSITSSKNNPQPIVSYQTWCENYSDTQWRVRIRAKLEEQDASTWLDYNNAEVKADSNKEMLRAQVTTMCSKKADAK